MAREWQPERPESKCGERSGGNRSLSPWRWWARVCAKGSKKRAASALPQACRCHAGPAADAVAQCGHRGASGPATGAFNRKVNRVRLIVSMFLPLRVFHEFLNLRQFLGVSRRSHQAQHKTIAEPPKKRSSNVAHRLPDGLLAAQYGTVT